MVIFQSDGSTSPIPKLYYYTFAVYEPILTVTGFLGALADPKKVCTDYRQKSALPNHPFFFKTHDGQAPWPHDSPPSEPLPRASLVSIIQLGHVCGLLGVINAFVLTAARKHLASQPAIQEKIVSSLLTPLLVGDILHLGITLWALGDMRWQVWRWSALLWTTMLLGLSLLLPRAAWHVGIGRYKHSRDGVRLKEA
jgi:hypothetical protein